MFFFPLRTTPRLLLRELRESDTDAVFKLRSTAEVNVYLDRHAPAGPDEALEFIRQIRSGQANRQWFYWAISRREHPELLGTVCLWNFSPDGLVAEIGYELHPDYQRQGLMREALTSVIDYARQELQLHGINAFTHRDNAASAGLLLRLGFQPLADSATEPTELRRYYLSLVRVAFQPPQRT